MSQTRQPPGIKIGGQFAATSHEEGDVTIDETPTERPSAIWPGTDVDEAEFPHIGNIKVGDGVQWDSPASGPGPVRTVKRIGLERTVKGHDGTNVVWGPGRQVVEFEPITGETDNDSGLDQRSWHRVGPEEVERAARDERWNAWQAQRSDL